jgi:hypothetical protein
MILWPIIFVAGSICGGEIQGQGRAVMKDKWTMDVEDLARCLATRNPWRDLIGRRKFGGEEPALPIFFRCRISRSTAFSVHVRCEILPTCKYDTSFCLRVVC